MWAGSVFGVHVIEWPEAYHQGFSGLLHLTGDGRLRHPTLHFVPYE